MAKKGSIDAAIQEYKMALHVNRNNNKACNNLGVALVATGDLDEAIRQFKEALRICPDDKNYTNNLTDALAAKKAQSEVTR